MSAVGANEEESCEYYSEGDGDEYDPDVDYFTFKASEDAAKANTKGGKSGEVGVNIVWGPGAVSSEDFATVRGPQGMTVPPWDELPFDLLSKIAQCGGGCRTMRAINRTWKAACEAATTKLAIRGTKLPMNLGPRFPSLTALNLFKCTSFTFDSLSALSSLGRLASLDINLIRVEPVGAFHYCEYLTEALSVVLRSLSLARLGFPWFMIFKNDHLEMIRDLPLDTLDLSHADDISLASLAVLKGMPMTRLQLPGLKCEVPDGLEFLRGMPLRSLELGVCSEFICTALEVLQTLPLTELSVGKGVRFQDGAYEIVRGITSLVSLEIGGFSSFSDDDLLALRGMLLISLFLPDDGSRFSAVGLQALVGMPLQHLKFPGFDGMKDSDLEFLKGMPLTSLDLEYARVTDAGLELLQDLPLTSINVEATWITEQGLKSFWEERSRNLRLVQPVRLD